MILAWKSFRVYLPDFKTFLDENVPKSDGINASVDQCWIVEAQTFTQTDIDSVNNYYDNLDEQTEASKFE